MNYEYPQHMKLSKKDEEEITAKLDYSIKNFLMGFFWFVTIPYIIIRRMTHNAE